MVQPRLTRGVPVVQNEPHLTKHVQRPSVEARRSGRHKLWPISLKSVHELKMMYFCEKISGSERFCKNPRSADLFKNYFSH